MIQKISRALSAHMVADKTIEAEEEPFYEYGIHQGIIILINWLTALLIGALTGMIWESLLLLLFFIPIRTYAGGYHAKSPSVCYIFSTAMQAGALLILKSNSFFVGMDLAVIIVTGLMILIFAPVATPNKPLDSDEKTAYKKKAGLHWAIETIIWVGLYLFHRKFADCIIMGFILVCSLVLLGAISNRINRNHIEPTLK